MLEDGLTSLLRSNATLTALIGTNLFPVLLPESTQFPALTYQVVSSSDSYSLEAAVVSEKRVQFDAWGNSYADCKNVLKALRATIDTFVGDLPDGTRVLNIERGVQIDFWEPDGRIYRCTAEYSLQFIEL